MRKEPQAHVTYLALKSKVLLFNWINFWRGRRDLTMSLIIIGEIYGLNTINSLLDDSFAE
jgi:hypothetical protein